MAQRRHHYERAFEHYLRTTRVPYVAVDEARKALLPEGARLELTAPDADGRPAALKSFDFVVYGESTNLLVEIKGRKIPRRPTRTGVQAPGGRLECWAGRDDISALSVWQGLFGPGFDAVLVFVYWCDAPPPDGLFQEVFSYQGRWYAVRAIGLADYAGAMKTRSPKWGTVDLPAPAFERLSHPFAPARGHAEPDRSTAWAPDAGPGTPALEPLGFAR